MALISKDGPLGELVMDDDDDDVQWEVGHVAAFTPLTTKSKNEARYEDGARS